MKEQVNFTTRFVHSVLSSKIPIFMLILSILAGLLALNFTPREEEPQIVVPMIDIVVTAPGINARQTQRLITTPLEKLLSQVKGVENVYSVSDNAKSVVTLRFSVGQNRQQALLDTYNKLHSNTHIIPEIVSDWRVHPIEVDDVPIVMLGLWSEDAENLDDFALRRLAEEVTTFLQALDNTSEVKIVGGRAREIQIKLNPEKMAARQVAMQDVFNAIQISNNLKHLGSLVLAKQSVILQSGDVYRDISSLENTPIRVIDGSAVLLKDIAIVFDGPSEQTSYTWIDFTNAHPTNRGEDHPFVTISIAKQKGSNAVDVANSVHKKVAELKKFVFPKAVQVEVLRDYGQTANEKVNNLVTSLAFAVFTVVVFIGVFLGWRPALVVGLAIPICYGITLSLDLAFGYTINRVTLFALILSLGLLVDDPITGVDNIERFLEKGKGGLKNTIVGAINEIRVPLVMSTFTIVLAFLPLAFITGMMGPYMAPMAFNVPISVLSSTLVAFLVTPWLASKFIKEKPKSIHYAKNQGFNTFYRKMLTPLLDDRKKGKRVLWVVLALFIIAAMLPVLRLVPLKLLPFDNKNEVQIMIDMPENATVEQTSAMAKVVSQKIQQLPEIKTVANYIGIASPIDFNGMVRQYYLRQKPNIADLRVLLIDKLEREHQSHEIVLRLRALLAPLNKNGINIRIVEVPPGPPVMSTLVAEITGDEYTQYDALRQAVIIVENRLKQEPHVVEVDAIMSGEQSRLRFITDKTKAALSGISTSDINQVLSIANKGKVVSFMHYEDEASPLAIKLLLPINERTVINDFKRIAVKGRVGIVQNTTAQGIDIAPQSLVSLGELGDFEMQVNDKPIYHKDLKPVVYVIADVSGRTPGEVIADVTADLKASDNKNIINDWQSRTFLNNGGGDLWQLPKNINLTFSGEGEWKITIRVFRDMGLAFAFALFAIYIVLRIQTGSAALSGIIMSSIPLTVIGIMPGFFLLNQIGEREISGAPEPVLFTATAMIGMIALAGIVVRNSLILIEFISQARKNGNTIKEALLQAGAVRMRPVLLTAGTTLLGNLVITLDPVFSGLAIAIIFGIISSTVFTLLVVPIVYSLIFDQPKSLTIPNEITL
ncbi:efflux RND transporter permease subunit [Pseudoalteromonas denitrificans]|uniref:Multidrug efflux pump subunit AcrB n=1 Tax=Pseudoalteromonas denitrificans DSM 6059 TaxID=1123010 RepID=A0A1I1SYM6_9GAMM|nr:efflux RND transporter permease subunit [Pseudoalteromonas denitrificans]SFD48120.1 Multidrug efflux pump subunit AcrB [Pseudoalteromonas denitrificans DSM 6059]